MLSNIFGSRENSFDKKKRIDLTRELILSLSAHKELIDFKETDTGFEFIVDYKNYVFINVVIKGTKVREMHYKYKDKQTKKKMKQPPYEHTLNGIASKIMLHASFIVAEYKPLDRDDVLYNLIYDIVRQYVDADKIRNSFEDGDEYGY